MAPGWPHRAQVTMMVLYSATGWPLLGAGSQPRSLSSVAALRPSAVAMRRRVGAVGRHWPCWMRDMTDRPICALAARPEGLRQVSSMCFSIYFQSFIFIVFPFTAPRTKSAEDKKARRAQSNKKSYLSLV